MKDMLQLCCRYFHFRVSFLGSSGLGTLGGHSNWEPMFCRLELAMTKNELLGALHSVLFFTIANDSMHTCISSVKYFVCLIFVVLLHLRIPLPQEVQMDDSFKQVICTGLVPPPKVLTQVALSCSASSVFQKYMLHRVVCESFVKPL